jgi:hypothetical protein
MSGPPRQSISSFSDSVKPRLRLKFTSPKLPIRSSRQIRLVKLILQVLQNQLFLAELGIEDVTLFHNFAKNGSKKYFIFLFNP